VGCEQSWITQDLMGPGETLQSVLRAVSSRGARDFFFFFTRVDRVRFGLRTLWIREFPGTGQELCWSQSSISVGEQDPGELPVGGVLWARRAPASWL
jgi:hypothetical protein